MPLVCMLSPPPSRLCNAPRLSVCVSVCLFVCLIASSRNTTERIFSKTLTQTYLWTRWNWLNIGSHPFQIGIEKLFVRFFNIAIEIGRFSTIWLISLDKLIESSLKFYHKMYLWTKKFPLNSGSYPDPKSGSRVQIRIRTPHTDSGSGSYSPCRRYCCCYTV